MRFICDAAENCCVRKVLSGAHPNFVRPPAMVIEEAIMQIGLTRGFGSNGKLINDGQMLRAIDQFHQFSSVHDEPVLKTLRHIESDETLLVGEAACAALRHLGQRCSTQAEPARERPSIQI